MAVIYVFLLLVAVFVDRGSCFTTITTPLLISTTTRAQRNALPFSPRIRVLSSATTSLLKSSSSSSSSITSEATIGAFEFRGHKVYSEVYSADNNNNNNKNLDVILIHGFGCSTVYWRETIRLLQQEGYTVHAIDLLGQGKSDKPGRATDGLGIGIEYSINLWAEQVDEYAKATIGTSNSKGTILMGNSLGSVVALVAATGDYTGENGSSSNIDDCYLRRTTKGIGMYNCGIGMNSQNVEYDFDGIQRVLVSALFGVLNTLVFGNVPLLTYVLDKVVTKELLRNALSGLYVYSTEDRVDDALVDSFYYPAKDPGSPQTLSQIYTNDPGSTPMQIYERHQQLLEEKIPIHLVWGRQDGITPLTGSVGRFFQRLSQDDGKSTVSMDVIDGGHIPFDEVPSCNKRMVDWLNTIQ